MILNESYIYTARLILMLLIVLTSTSVVVAARQGQKLKILGSISLAENQRSKASARDQK
jgi:hypothetical protein